MNKVFCNKCNDFKGTDDQLKYHYRAYHSKCSGYTDYDPTLNEKRGKLINHCKTQCIRTISYFMHSFKPILGKDIVSKIGKLIYYSIDDYPMWNICPPKRNVNIKRNKRKINRRYFKSVVRDYKTIVDSIY